MGDDTVIVVPEVPPSDTNAPDTTRDEILIQFGEISAKVAALEASLEALYARIERSETEIISIREGFNGISVAVAGLAEIGHIHSEYATTEHEHAGPSTDAEPREPDTEPENQHWYFRKLGS